MLKRIGLSLLMLALITTSLYAAEVCATKREKFYHFARCSKIKNQQISILDDKQAEARGLRACPKCFKDNDKKQK